MLGSTIRVVILVRHRLTVKEQGEFFYTISPNPDPVISIEPGSTIEVETVDAFEEKIESEETKPSKVIQKPQINPTSGPIYIEGANKGDALKIDIEDITPRGESPKGTTCLIQNFGGLSPTNESPTLNEPLPEIVKKVPVTPEGIEWNENITLPYQPFIGTIGTSPELQAIQSFTPGSWGGNMDMPDVCPGNTLYLPVNTEGGYLYLGDCHAVQGDGELSGVAIEISANVTISVDIVQNWTLRWPRIENENILMSIGAQRPLDDAARIAYYDLISWLVEEFKFNKLDAYMLLSQIGRAKVGNMVDPNYTIGASIAKEFVRT